MSQQSGDFTFFITRVDPEKAFEIQKSYLLKKNNTTHDIYNVINDEKRYMIIYKILNKEMTVNEISKQYGIKYTTIRSIMNAFEKEGRIEKAKNRRKFHISKRINTIKKLPNMFLVEDSKEFLNEKKLSTNDNRSLTDIKFQLSKEHNN